METSGSISEEASLLLSLPQSSIMVDHYRAESSDVVSLDDAKKRSALISSEGLEYAYKLALRMGDTFLGEVIVKFRALSNAESIWLNTSVHAIGGVIFNGTDLS